MPDADRSIMPVAEELQLSGQEKDMLRTLAEQVAEIAQLPVQQEKARLWQRLNDLQSERPMVWINEICWHEMNVDNELTLRTEHAWAREQEQELRRTLYQWRHLPGDMIVNDFLICPLVIHSTGFGIADDVDIVKTDEASDIFSRRFKTQIRDFCDLEKIKMPMVTYDAEATGLRYQAMCDVYADILPVRKVGQKHIHFTPWDHLLPWWGVEEALTALVEKPDLVHAAVERVVEAYIAQLNQFEALNLLSLDSNNTRIGSGGYGYTSELPGARYDPARVRPHNMWGFSNAQIFSAVSPEMHWEFAIAHDLRWLSRWGLVYYGCCEQLDGKLDLLRRIPKLRKISASPWCKTDRLIEKIGSEYVISRKPTPAVFAVENWNLEAARLDLVTFLERTGGRCHVEIIMKDISTVRYEPRRLWEWAAMAVDVAERFAN